MYWGISLMYWGISLMNWGISLMNWGISLMYGVLVLLFWNDWGKVFWAAFFRFLTFLERLGQ